MAVHITGTMGLPSGDIYPNCTMYFERSVGVVSQGGFAVVPEKTTVTSNGAALVDFYLLFGNYIGTIQTTLGVIKFQFSVLDVATATFTSCIGNVSVPIPAESVAAAAASASSAAASAAAAATFDPALYLAKSDNLASVGSVSTARTNLGLAPQTSAVDTAASRLLTVGAFGLGVIGTAPVLAAIDATTTASGTYSYTTGATGTFPSGVTAAAGGVIVMYRESATKGYMTLQPSGGTFLYYRNLSTTWGAWQAVAGLNSPVFAGVPAVPTAAVGTDTTQIASTAYVKNEIPAALNASGSAPIYACRAWVNFNGTGTVAIRASGNVSSITDNGVGEYTVNFTTAMQDTNYAVSGLANISSDAVPINLSLNYTQLASSFRVRSHSTSGATAFDVDSIQCIVVR